LELNNRLIFLTRKLTVGGAIHPGRTMRASPPKSNKTYLQREYWDTRFQEETEYDWFKGYEEFRTLMNRNVKKEVNVLIVGCGNSGMTEAMYKDGYHSIVSTDLSKVVIDKMAQKSASNGCEGKWVPQVRGASRTPVTKNAVVSLAGGPGLFGSWSGAKITEVAREFVGSVGLKNLMAGWWQTGHLDRIARGLVSAKGCK
jgi:hypothetical protein